MKITYLGQAGLLFETCGKTILIDPYLSDSVVKINPLNYRRQPVDESYLRIHPDVILCTHDHMDHYDEETLMNYLNADHAPICVLAPYSAWGKAKKFGCGHNYVIFNRGTVWTEGDVRFTAVKAEHSDLYAIGVILEAEGKRYYITGDTLYNREIFVDLPEHIDAVFLPVNGVGNNMNMTDAAAFAAKSGAKVAVPLHVGLFDNLSGQDFAFEPKVVPEIYREINL